MGKESEKGWIHMCVDCCCLVAKSCLTLTLQTVACQISLSVGFLRQEYWSGLPAHSPENLPDPGTEPAPRLLHWQVDPGGSDGKESACHVGELGSVPRLGRCPAERDGYPLQYSCLKNPMCHTGRLN